MLDFKISRSAALDAILAFVEPERASRLLLGHHVIQVDEVTLRAPMAPLL
ncbi:MAG: hypothetical protein JO029_07915 [Candidatus Eremiobacteraeota bacterium]|nr:hypothetical protein [Candidatus Eremiobacteraeota bacterium]MBV8582373.1 hypothetical protein [Candidatus Eremiobacteraeota bacterium]